MRLIKHVKAISSLSLIILLLCSAIVGALLSYLWVVGYYVSLEKVYPENPFVTIENVTFDPQNTRFFNVLVECPTSYEANEAARITRMLVSTDNDTEVHDVAEVSPSLPYLFSNKGESKTFRCTWNWANYTGQTVGVSVVVEDGSRFTSPDVAIPLVDLRITDVRFDPTTSATHFNVTVQNSRSSAAANVTVDIAEIAVITEDGLEPNIIATDPALPWSLDLDASQEFTCAWDWTEHQNTTVTIAVHTSQGYMNFATEKTPSPVILEITEVLFDVANTTRLDVTVKNENVSLTDLRVTEFGVVVGNQTLRRWTEENGTAVNPPIPFTLSRGSTETFVCPWDWTDHRDQEVTVILSTAQGFAVNYTRATSPPVILDITDVSFDPIDTKQLSFTVRNSDFSLADTEITEALLTIENKVVANLTGLLGLPTPLNRTHSTSFTCTWDWAEQLGGNTSIAVKIEQGYSFYSNLGPLVPLKITSVTFNPVAADYFTINIQNPTLLDFSLATVSVSVDGPSQDLTDEIAPSFPFSLPAGADYTFVCLWEEWIDKQGEEATITVEALHGYQATHTIEIPSVLP